MADIDPVRLPQGVSASEGPGGLPVLTVSTPACTGEVHLHGAHVTAWAPQGAQPVLWMSGQSHFDPDASIRGGVPICGPWFGPGRAGGREPAHGFLRLTRWTLADASAADDDAVTLVFAAGPEQTAGRPGADDYPGLTARYTVTMGRTLELSLEVTAGEAKMELEEALHAYLTVADITATTVEGLDGARYADKAPGGRAVNAQFGPVEFKRQTDRVYASTEPVAVVDPGLRRRITVEKEGSASTVVWNPWDRKAAELEDFGDDEWTGMVCIEPANALNGHVKLEAGASHTITARFGVEPL